MREDQILPHLAAVAILLASGGQPGGNGTVQVTAPAETVDLIDRLRDSGAVLTYDPGDPDHPRRRQRARCGHRLAATADTHWNNNPGKEGQEGSRNTRYGRRPNRVTSRYARKRQLVGY